MATQQQPYSLMASDRVEGTAVYGADRQRIGSIEWSTTITKRLRIGEACQQA